MLSHVSSCDVIKVINATVLYTEFELSETQREASSRYSTIAMPGMGKKNKVDRQESEGTS